jgi:hypothetical protein
MAEMLPAVPSGVTSSSAELHLFKRFKTEAPADWIVLHSLGLRSHGRKPWAEADFVVIMPEGVFVIEVKGGNVRREGRRWFTNKSQLSESPFDQAGGASAALFHDLRPHVTAIREAIVGYAVAFPDVSFEQDGADLVAELVYDADDREHPLKDWLDRVVSYWNTKLAQAVPAQRRGLSKETRRQVVEHLAGDFDLRTSLRARLTETELEFIRLTGEQATIMEALSTNQRMIVSGGAGTGKTLLALEEIKRASDEDQSVLFLCHTRALAQWVRQQIGDRPGVTVSHFNGLTVKLISEAHLADRITDAPIDQVFRIEHPELALEALLTISDPPSYDVLVVDEAQDILNVPAVEFLDGLVRGGLARGNWRLLLDPRQDVFNAMDIASVGELAKATPTRFRLQLNCRNTAQIATQTSVLSTRELEETLPVSGADVAYLRYSDERDLRKQIAKTLTAWIEGGIRPSEIVILGMQRRDKTVLADGLPAGVPAQLFDLDDSLDAPDGAVRYATAAGFKGLESEAILLIDIGRLPPGNRANDVYVAMSRARSLLAVGLRRDLSDAHDELSREFGARLLRSARRP